MTAGARPPLHFGPFVLDRDQARLTRDGTAVPLQPRSFDVLVHLAERPGLLLTKDHLLDAVWGHRHVGDSALKTAMSHLRTALDDDPKSPRWVETIPRRGYRFVATLQDTVPAALPATDGGAAGAPGTPPASSTAPAGSEPIVGQEAVLQRLAGLWQQAAQGRSQLVLLAGDPGMGKSTLAATLAARAGGARVAQGQCVEPYGAGEPYLPVLEAMDALCTREPALLPLLRQVAPTWLLQWPWHLSEAERAALARELAGATQERMLREMGVLLERLAQQQPLLLLIEDLHWSDAATVRLLHHLARRRGAARLMIVCTFRPAELVLSEHAFETLRRELLLHGLCEQVTLQGLDETQIARYLTLRFGHADWPAPWLRALHTHTGGLPLFLRRVIDELVDTGLLQQRGGGRWQLSAHASSDAPARLPVPDSLVGVIALQIERLPGELRRLLEAAALCGQEFWHRPLAEALGLDADAVQAQCAGLVRRGLWLREMDAAVLPDGRRSTRFAFGHALYRHAFEHRIGHSDRAELHRRIGHALEAAAGSGDSPLGSLLAADLAQHAERGGEPARAAAYLAQAARNALRRLAPQEADQLASRGLVLTAVLPAGAARDALRFELLSARIPALTVTQGYAAPPTRAAIGEAAALAEHLPAQADTAPLWHAMLWAQFIAGDIAECGEQATRLRQRAQAQGDVGQRIVAGNLLGMVALTQGRFADALPELQASLQAQATLPAAQLGTPRFIHDLRIEAQANLALSLEALSRRTEADACHAQIDALIAAGTDPLSEVTGLWFIAYAHHLRGDVAACRAAGERARPLMTSDDGTPLAEPNRLTLGWALVAGGDPGGLALVHEGLAGTMAQGMQTDLALLRAMAADALLRAGELAAAKAQAEAALAVCLEIGDRLALAEIQRVLGAVSQAQGQAEEAARWLAQAAQTAQQQGAHLLLTRVQATQTAQTPQTTRAPRR